MLGLSALVSLIEAIDCPIAVLDTSGNYLASNKKLKSLLGLSNDKISGCEGHFFIFDEFGEEKTRSKILEFFSGHGSNLELKATLTKSNGAKFRASLSYKRPEDRKSECVFLTVGEDEGHTETGSGLGSAELFFNLVMENIEDVFWIADVDTSKTFFVSKSYEKMWGRSLASIYEDPTSFIDAIVPEDRASMFQAIQVQKLLGEKWSLEYRIERPSGEIRWIHDRAFPVPNTSDGAGLYVGIARDVTDLKSLRDELERERVDRHLARVTGILAHDFNNILGIALLNASQIRAHEEYKGSLDKTISAIRKGAELSRAVVGMIKKTEMPPQVILVDEFIDDCSALLLPRHGSKSSLSIRLRAPLIKIQVSRSGLLNALLNLSLNAHKSVECAGGGYVKIVTKVQEDEEGPQSVSISVLDDGVGFADVPKGGDVPVSEVALGVGLISVNEFCKRNGALLRVRNRIERGAEISMTFPIALARTDRHVESRNVKTEAQPKKLLIVDDEPDIARSLANLLGRYGYYCEVALDGLKAQEALQGASFDMIISDVVMPGLDGIALATWVEENQPDTKVLLMSGYIPDFRDTKGKYDLVEKPIDFDQMVERIRMIFELMKS